VQVSYRQSSGEVEESVCLAACRGLPGRWSARGRRPPGSVPRRFGTPTELCSQRRSEVVIMTVGVAWPSVSLVGPPGGEPPPGVPSEGVVPIVDRQWPTIWPIRCACGSRAASPTVTSAGTLPVFFSVFQCALTFVDGICGSCSVTTMATSRPGSTIWRARCRIWQRSPWLRPSATAAGRAIR
jgi:hypothetical protein